LYFQWKWHLQLREENERNALPQATL